MAKRAVNQERRAEIGRERRAKTRAKIIAAAFEIFGEENGLYARIEDVAEKAGITRTTFYSHFSGMEELRDALSYEVTHDFLVQVTLTAQSLPDPRDRTAIAIRYYLQRARSNSRWAWSMLNMSANGMIFGAETYRQAELTVVEGMEAGVFPIPSSALGRDLIMGSSLAAIGAMLREDLPEDYPEEVAGFVLLGLGVPREFASAAAHAPLPPLLTPLT
jgi:AcrR family transcriptional regulator